MTYQTIENQAKHAAIAAELASAIAAAPGTSGDKAEGIRLARKAITARKLLAKLESAPAFYEGLYDVALQTHGMSGRDAICDLLRAYFKVAGTYERQQARKAATAARRAVRKAPHPYELEKQAGDCDVSHLVLEVRAENRARAAEYSAAFKKAAQPQPDATAEENAAAAAGYAKLLAAGAFNLD